MRTFSKHSDSHIAIMTESAKSFWKTITLQPCIEFSSTMSSYLFPVFVPVAVQMIYTKKLHMRFTATRANLSVMLEYFYFNGLFALAVISSKLFFIRLVILFLFKIDLFPVFLSPCAITGFATIPMFPIVPPTRSPFCFCIHNDLLYHKITWDGKTIFGKGE